MLTINSRSAALRASSNRRSVSSTAAINSSSRRRSVQRTQHRNPHHYRLAAIPDEQNTGRRPGGPQDIGVGSDVPSSDTNPDMDPAESKKYSQREEAEGVANFAESGSSTLSSGSSGTEQQSGGRDVSDMIQDLSGGAGGAASRMRAMDKEQMTGTRPGGPQDIGVGSDVPSSDTNPDMDPAESPTYSKREESEGLANANTSGSSSSSSSPDPHSLGAGSEVTGQEVTMSAEEGGGFAGSGRDLSDMLNEGAGASSSSSSSSGTSGSGGRGEALTGSGVGVGYDAESARVDAEGSEAPNPRAHPVARTAGAAAASAAGTILGAVAGPVGAAAGAAVGAALGRRAADLLGGSEEQGEVYDKGEEPEQVADELKTAGSEIRGAAHTAQHKASELVDRAGERLQRDTGGSSAEGKQFRTDRGIAFDSGLGDITALSADLGSTDPIFNTESGKMEEHPRSSDSSRSKVSDVAKSAADRVAGAAESLKESAVDAAHTAADKIQGAADKVPFPEFPPAADADDFNAAGGGVRLEDDQALQAAKERVSGVTDSARDRLGSAAAEVKDTARSAAAAASERLSGAGDRAADAAASTARTAADYGAPDTSERLQEMNDKGKDVGGATDSHDWMDQGSAGGGLSSVDWGLGSEVVRDSGYYKYRSVDEGGDSRHLYSPLANPKPKQRGRSKSSSRSSDRDASDQGGAASSEAVRTAAAAAAADVSAGSSESSAVLLDAAAAFSSGQGFKEDGEASPSPTGDTPLPNADWGSSSANRDWGSAETVVKTDVGSPTGAAGGPGDISSLGAAAASGGYGDAAADMDIDTVRGKAGGISGVESKEVGAYATRGLGDPQPGYREGSRGEISGIPAGRLAAGGEDAQAAVAAEPESLSQAATSDSTAERVAQVYGVGPEASSGVQEADTYRAEADSDRKADSA